ncbi:hypothetical protein K2X89_15160, partial [Myxococcota bacterium]|nr:hypothetical protein [Myxococcota bacterium]
MTRFASDRSNFARLASALAVAFIDVLAVDPVCASDGILEINQTCATLSGCFSGDAPGFPVTIDGTAGSSYLLTSDLVVRNVNTDGIFVSVARISIDLNGFGVNGGT